MHSILGKISETGIIPVIAIDQVDHAVPLAKALILGGLPIAEVTFRTKAAEEAIRRIASEEPNIVIGAGTVLTCEQVDRAISAGAQFIVSPGFNPEVVDYALSQRILVIPGTATPSEMEKAISHGLSTVKFFPAEQSGGVAYLKAISAPYPGLTFIPTGGINADNLSEYISFEKVLACGGSWMVKKSLIESGNFEAITLLAKQAVNRMFDFQFAHIGINADNDQDAIQMAQFFSTVFGFDYTVGSSSIFSSSRTFELMKQPGRGANGHLAIHTNSISRATAYIKRMGFDVDEQSAVTKNGKTIAIYLKGEFLGFSIHLLQKS